MQVHVHHYFHDEFGGHLEKILHAILKQGREIMATQKELVDGLNSVTEQLKKVADESQSLLQKVADLEAALGNVDNVPQAVDDAFQALKKQAQVVDDKVGDATPPTTVGNI